MTTRRNDPREARCWEALLRLGLLPSSRGFPPFLAWSPDKRSACFIFIRRGHRLKPKQEAVASLLHHAGLPVFLFTGSGLDRFRPREDPHETKGCTTDDE